MLQGWLQIVALPRGARRRCVPLLGGYMARVYTRRARLPHPGRSGRSSGCSTGSCASTRARAGLEGATRAACWSSRLVSWLALYLILRTQTHRIPFNPQGFHSGTWDVTFNTTSSFVTNTNWQFYGGETTMTLLQPDGRAGGAELRLRRRSGSCVAIALIRGIVARSGKSLGNFWQDLVRTLLYVLLPISVVGALVLVSQGVIQNFADYATAHTLTGRHAVDRDRPGGLAGGHQGARHQRRRLLQRQLRAPVREPDRRSPTSSRCCSILLIPAALDLHLRAHGRQPPPGLGDLLGDDDPVPRRRRRRLHRRAARHAGPAPRRRAHAPLRRLDRRQPRGQGAALRHRRLGAVGRRSRPSPRAARSTARSSRSPASAAPCRSPTCR